MNKVQIMSLVPGDRFIKNDRLYCVIVNNYRRDEGWNIDVLDLKSFQCKYFYHDTKVEKVEDNE